MEHSIDKSTQWAVFEPNDQSLWEGLKRTVGSFLEKKLGAKVIKDVAEVPEMGWLSIISDPTGAKLGLWQTKEPSQPRTRTM